MSEIAHGKQANGKEANGKARERTPVASPQDSPFAPSQFAICTAARFHWALLDEPCPRLLSPRRRARLGYTFESVLPAPIESVHAAYAPAGDRTVACAMDRDELEQIRAGGAIALHPAAAPAFIADQVEPPLDRLNLLTGAFEPPALTRHRRRRALETIAAIILVTAILGLGAQRRIDAARAAAAAADTARLALLADILPPAPGATQAPELRLVGELRRLQRTRAAPAADLAPPDAAAPLADLLAAWPADLHVRTRQLRASPTEVHIQVAFDAIEQADVLAAALGEARGWQARFPQVGPERSGGYLASITLRRVEPAAGSDEPDRVADGANGGSP